MSNRRVTGHGAGLICSMPPFAGERDVRFFDVLMRRLEGAKADAEVLWDAWKQAKEDLGCLHLYTRTVRRCVKLKALAVDDLLIRASVFSESATGVSGGARPGGSSVTAGDADLFRVDSAAPTGRVFFQESGVRGQWSGERRTA